MWIRVGAAAIILLFILYRVMQRQGVAFISVHVVKARLNAKEEFRLIDVGQFDAYKQAHLKGAINLPQSFLKQAAPDLDPKVETILYCQNGQQSMAAYKELKALGFTDVKVMEGGLARWSWDVIGDGKRKS
jgi:rhodanese-related sulfurtransferase